MRSATSLKEEGSAQAGCEADARPEKLLSPKLLKRRATAEHVERRRTDAAPPTQRSSRRTPSVINGAAIRSSAGNGVRARCSARRRDGRLGSRR